MNSDPISNMLTRVKNAYTAGKKQIELSHSKLIEKLALVLAENGYIKSVRVERKNNKTFLQIVLYETPPFGTIERISKLGRRVYVGKNNIPRVLGGMGRAIISTPKGLMTGEKARRQNLGGELICKIY